MDKKQRFEALLEKAEEELAEITDRLYGEVEELCGDGVMMEITVRTGQHGIEYVLVDDDGYEIGENF